MSNYYDLVSVSNNEPTESMFNKLKVLHGKTRTQLNHMQGNVKKTLQLNAKLDNINIGIDIFSDEQKRQAYDKQLQDETTKLETDLLSIKESVDLNQEVGQIIEENKKKQEPKTNMQEQQSMQRFEVYRNGVLVENTILAILDELEKEEYIILENEDKRSRLKAKLDEARATNYNHPDLRALNFLITYKLSPAIKGNYGFDGLDIIEAKTDFDNECFYYRLSTNMNRGYHDFKFSRGIKDVKVAVRGPIKILRLSSLMHKLALSMINRNIDEYHKKICKSILDNSSVDGEEKLIVANGSFETNYMGKVVSKKQKMLSVEDNKEIIDSFQEVNADINKFIDFLQNNKDEVEVFFMKTDQYFEFMSINQKVDEMIPKDLENYYSNEELKRNREFCVDMLRDIEYIADSTISSNLNEYINRMVVIQFDIMKSKRINDLKVYLDEIMVELQEIKQQVNDRLEFHKNNTLVSKGIKNYMQPVPAILILVLIISTSVGYSTVNRIFWELFLPDNDVNVDISNLIKYLLPLLSLIACRILRDLDKEYLIKTFLIRIIASVIWIVIGIKYFLIGKVLYAILLMLFFCFNPFALFKSR